MHIGSERLPRWFLKHSQQMPRRSQSLLGHAHVFLLLSILQSMKWFLSSDPKIGILPAISRDRQGLSISAGATSCKRGNRARLRAADGKIEQSGLSDLLRFPEIAPVEDGF